MALGSWLRGSCGVVCSAGLGFASKRSNNYSCCSPIQDLGDYDKFIPPEE